MLSKGALFRLVKATLRSKCRRSFEEFQDSFDHHLRQSLTIMNASIAHTTKEKANNTRPTRTFRCSYETILNGAGKKEYDSIGISQGIGIDSFKPFEIVMAYQLLASQCSPANQSPLVNCACPKFRERIYSLIWLAWFHVDEFSFVKLSLLLNSLANIIQNTRMSIDDIDMIGNTDEFCTTYPVVVNASDVNNQHCIWDSEYRANKCIIGALKVFDKDATSRLMLSLWINTGILDKCGETDNTIGSIDVHGICMILKYYATMQSASVEMLYSICTWLKQQSQFQLRDKINIVVHLSKMTNRKLFQPHGSNSIHTAVENNIKRSLENTTIPQILRSHVEDVLSSFPRDNQQTQPYVVIEALLNTLTEKPTVGNANINILQLYMNAIVQLRLQGIGPRVIGNIAISAMNDAAANLSCSSVGTGNDFKSYTSLLRSIRACMQDVEALSPSAVHRFFFSKDFQSAILSSMLDLVKQPSSTPMSSIADFCSSVTFLDMDDTLDVNHASALARLKGTLRELVQLCHQNIKDGMYIRDIIGTYGYLGGNRRLEMDAQRRLLNIYAGMSGAPQTVDLVRAYADTIELFYSLYKTKQTLEPPVHTQISAFLSVSYLSVSTQNSALYLKVVQMISRVCRSDKQLFMIYDCIPMLDHAFKTSDLEGNVMVFVEVVYNLLTSLVPSTSKENQIQHLESLLEHYYVTVISPIITSRRHDYEELVETTPDCGHPIIDIATFAKYIRIAWELNSASDGLKRLWSRLSALITDDLYLFTNTNSKISPRRTALGIRPSTKVLRSQRWQAFSVYLVADILRQLHFDNLAQNIVAPSVPTKEQQAIFFLLDMLMEGLDDFKDNTASLTQLLGLITDNSGCFGAHPKVKDIECRIKSLISNTGVK